MSFNDFRVSPAGLARLGMAAAVSALLALSPAIAQDAAPAAPAAESPATPADPTEVLAKVGDKEITRADVTLAAELFAEQLAQVPDAQRDQILVDALIDIQLVAAAARAEGLDGTDVHKQRMEFLENQALRTAYIEKNVQDAVTDDDLRARYEKDVAGYTPPEEVKAAHILVETEEEAKAVIDQLNAGGDFAAIAKEKSMDPGSKETGGDLGYFTKGQMVPEFEAEAFALAPGEMSKAPVKTQFGFHVLKVEDKRSQPVPSFEDVREQIAPAVQRERFDALMANLRAGTTVERFGAAAAEAPAAPEDEGDEAGEAEDEAEGEAPAAQ